MWLNSTAFYIQTGQNLLIVWLPGWLAGWLTLPESVLSPATAVAEASTEERPRLRNLGIMRNGCALEAHTQCVERTKVVPHRFPC